MMAYLESIVVGDVLPHVGLGQELDLLDGGRRQPGLDHLPSS